MNKSLMGHACAVFTVFIWGITFVSSKVILEDLTPLELLFDRFLIAFIAFTVFMRSFWLYPSLKLNLYAASAAFFGITFYFMLENGALTYAPAANVSLIVSSAPLFVGIVDRICGDSKRLSCSFWTGFVVAFAGIACLSWNSLQLSLNPLGDLFSVMAAVSWAFYNLFVRKIYVQEPSVAKCTQILFFYGVLLCLPLMLFQGFELKAESLVKPEILWNLLFLSVLCSSVGFASWNEALHTIGPIKTNVYLYGQPVITAIFAYFLIDEPVTFYTVSGMILITLGLLISQDVKMGSLLKVLERKK